MPEKRRLFSSLTEWLGKEGNGLRNNYWSRNLEIEQFLGLNFLKVGTARVQPGDLCRDLSRIYDLL